MYVGYTADLRERLALHNAGKVKSMKARRPFQLVYYEACLSHKDVLRREQYLKTAYGECYIKNRLRGYLDGLDWYSKGQGFDSNSDATRVLSTAQQTSKAVRK